MKENSTLHLHSLLTNEAKEYCEKNSIKYVENEHSYFSEVTREPSCSHEGERTYTCKLCGDSYTESIEKIPHMPAIDPAVAANCTKTGLTEGSHCKMCSQILKKQEIVPALGHDYVSKVTKEATCTSMGEITYSCNRCGNTYIEYTDKIPHSYQDTAINPTCGEKGFTIHKCKVCGYSYTDMYVEATGLHNYTVTTVEPTCTEQGYTRHTCLVCKKYYDDNIRNALGHMQVIDEDIESTCTSTGLTQGSHCSRCNKVLVAQQTIPKKAHTWSNKTVVPATCTQAGYTQYICSVCNEVKKEDDHKALGHNYQKSATLKAASVICTGIDEYTCARCGDKKQVKTDQIKVDINTNTNYGRADFTVVDAKTKKPISGASIFVSTEKEGENTFATDENGKVSIFLPVGEVMVSAYAQNCKARNVKLNIAQGINTIAPIGLSSQNVYDAKLTSKEMSLEEIKAAGIDTENKENLNLYKYELKITFTPEIDMVSLMYYMNPQTGKISYGSGEAVYPKSSGSGGESQKIVWVSDNNSEKGGFGKGYFYIPEIKTKIIPVSETFYLIIRGEVSWLKEMFDVEMLVINNSATDTLENLKAELTLPDGLSLAAMKGKQQMPTQNIGTIPSNSSKSVHWYVRGDKEGNYDISAKLTGKVMPFNEIINDTFKGENQIQVLGGSALRLNFEFPNAAYHGEDYDIKITLENVSDKTLYNISHMVQIEQGMNIVYDDGTHKTRVEKSEWFGSQKIEKFKPGDKLIITASVNIFFESEAMEMLKQDLIGMVDNYEALMNSIKAVQNMTDIISSFGKTVINCGKALDSVTKATVATIDSEKLNATRTLANSISSLNSVLGASGNKVADSSAMIANAGFNVELDSLKNAKDPIKWIEDKNTDDILSLANSIAAFTKALKFEKSFNIYDSLRTAISAMPVRYVVNKVEMNDEFSENTTKIPWSYSISQASPQYFGVSNVSKYVSSLALAACGQAYKDYVPWYFQLIDGVDDPFNYKDAVNYVKATENEISKFKAKDATGKVEFEAWVENENNKTAKSKIRRTKAKTNNFKIECNNENAVFENGVLKFTGDTEISVTPLSQTDGTLYVKDNNNHLYTYKLEVVKPHKCNSDEQQIISDPSSTKNGYAVKKCSICGEIQDVVELSKDCGNGNHSYTAWKTVSKATCKTQGVNIRSCIKCGKTETELIPIDAKNHEGPIIEGKNARKAEHMIDGYTGDKICQSCQKTVEKGSVIPKEGHTWEVTVSKHPTCTLKGEEKYICSVCSQSNTFEIPALGHNYVNGTCTRCGAKDPNYSEPVIPSNPSKPSKPVPNPANNISAQIKTFSNISVKLKKVKKGKKSFTVQWKKAAGVDGYQVQYSLKKNMKKSKKKTVKASKSKLTVKKLKKGNKYYVRIRTYKTINGKKVYGKWSAKKTVKVK